MKFYLINSIILTYPILSLNHNTLFQNNLIFLANFKIQISSLKAIVKVIFTQRFFVLKNSISSLFSSRQFFFKESSPTGCEQTKYCLLQHKNIQYLCVSYFIISCILFHHSFSLLFGIRPKSQAQLLTSDKFRLANPS